VQALRSAGNTMKIFISYASTDRATAERLYGDLKAAGAEPFEFNVSTTGDAAAFEEITRWIADCDAFVLLVSAAALESNAVLEEINVARHGFINARRPGKIVPAILDASVEPPLVVQHLSRVDLIDYDVGRARLLSRLGLDAAATAAPEPAPAVDLDHVAPLAAPVLRREGDRLAWDPVPGATGYVVASRLGRGRWVQAYAGADTSMHVNPMSYNLMAVECKARAVAEGDTSDGPWSASVVFGPGAAGSGVRPGPPTLALNAGNLTAMLTWSPVPDVSSYQLERNAYLASARGPHPWQPLYEGRKQAYVDSDRSGEHAYRVRAQGPWGDTDWSDEVVG
jgi:hypothetical protein